MPRSLALGGGPNWERAETRRPLQSSAAASAASASSVSFHQRFVGNDEHCVMAVGFIMTMTDKVGGKEMIVKRAQKLVLLALAGRNESTNRSKIFVSK